MPNSTSDATEAIHRSFEPAEDLAEQAAAAENDRWLNTCLDECYND